MRKKEESDFRLNQARNLPDETWQRLLGNKGPVKTKMRTSLCHLGAKSIFRLTSTSGAKFIFEVTKPKEGMALVVISPPDSLRKSYEDRTYLEECFVGTDTIELGDSLFFTKADGELRRIYRIAKIEILEEHPPV